MTSELVKGVGVLKSSEGRDILTDYTYPKDKEVLPLVIFCHGYKGFKDWGAWHLGIDEIARSGCFAVKMNFSMNGTTKDAPEDFVDLEAFGNSTYSQEQRDLASVIAHYRSNPLVANDRVFLIGHSRGGGAVLLQGYHNEEVTGIITWAGVSDFRKRFPHHERFEKWKQEGVFYVVNGRTNQQMPHYFIFWEDYIANEERLNVQKAAQHINKPVLIVQGTQDPAVPLKEAHLLHQWINDAKLVEIEGADHVFGAKHPYLSNELPSDLAEVIGQTIDFIKNN
ncbi:alpha/beta hydrolase family protein [Myroides pelagicus]|uniref:Alpha/beta fold hydrolase n=1 Tax=Myroides pelagicus TaxID=270914 RepID=A0A7K1GMX9_9FLAO|nr:alpha/beta fold hydrolase [Myroides pelagicus]MEC4114897.1 alpha/beta fold hydrolase [Myroides pelagicus]MTH30255.1 alpha/beta fold hydrolase [Myroides pelagicus]